MSSNSSAGGARYDHDSLPPAEILRRRSGRHSRAGMGEIGTGTAQQFILGEAVSRLEARLREDTGARHAIACGSGSAALMLALRALGVGPGDEVIVPAFGCQPIAGMAANLGATPVFVDIDARNLVLDPALAADAVTARTVAIVPVHVFSVLADMPAFAALARRYRLKVVEDAAVAVGVVSHGGRRAAAETWA